MNLAGLVLAIIAVMMGFKFGFEGNIGLLIISILSGIGSGAIIFGDV